MGIIFKLKCIECPACVQTAPSSTKLKTSRPPNREVPALYNHQRQVVNTEQTAGYHNTNYDTKVYLSIWNPSEIYSTSSATTISRTKVLHGGKPNLTTDIARMVTNVAQIKD